MANEMSVWYALANAVGEQLGMPGLGDRVTFEWSGQMSRTIANARPRQWRIRVNRDAWPFLNEDERDKVIVHELCHIVVGNSPGPRETAHGPRWRRAMRQCGYSPDVTAKMPEVYKTAVAHKRRRQTRYTYYCRCQSHQLTARKAKNLQFLRCRKCGSSLHSTPLTI